MNGHADPFDLNDPGTYPATLRSFLEENLDAYVEWFTDGPRRSGFVYDDLSRQLTRVLSGYRVRGYHCTRLTLAEQEAIRASGMVVSTAGFIERRVKALVDGGMTGDLSLQQILDGHLAGDSNRAGKIWFTFSPPGVHGERGVGPFFRRWGGESLHRVHLAGSAVDRLLQTTGMPCIIEVAVLAARSRRMNGGPTKCRCGFSRPKALTLNAASGKGTRASIFRPIASWPCTWRLRRRSGH
ncbi:hypothetical protein ABIE56_000408 [Luteibacter sp. 621]|uniref:hypothetical protein n=1 Tax=Luteibacter sp. 621 TaxID=3373916 RepID=UPI003D232531